DADDPRRHGIGRDSPRRARDLDGIPAIVETHHAALAGRHETSGQAERRGCRDGRIDADDLVAEPFTEGSVRRLLGVEEDVFHARIRATSSPGAARLRPTRAQPSTLAKIARSRASANDTKSQ